MENNNFSLLKANRDLGWVFLLKAYLIQSKELLRIKKREKEKEGYQRVKKRIFIKNS